MEIGRFEDWLTGLKTAWEKRDPQEAMRLFADDIEYWESPFEGPIYDRQTIQRLWLEVPKSHKNIKVQTTILVVQGSLCIAQWKATFTRLESGKKAELDGIYKIILNKEGLCSEFRQWWNSKET